MTQMLERVTVREQLRNATPEAGAVPPFRPRNRPPMALLMAFDDGSTVTGEVWRIRGPRTVIGRRHGDIVIRHDPDMSAEHAELTCDWQDGAYVWHLRNLKSKNGVFLRVKKGLLSDGMELIIGGQKLKFRLVDQPPVQGKAVAFDQEATRRLLPAAPTAKSDRTCVELVPLNSKRTAKPFELRAGKSRIGTAVHDCQVVLEGDPFVSARHAQIRIDSKGRWVIQDEGSLNGTWLQIECVRLENDSEFQLGEQRFRFQVLTDK